MSGKFLVLNGKNILGSLLIVSVLTVMCMAGSSMVSNIIETAVQNRLLPIYSVETSEKKVALTFDCAWGADDIPDIINTLESNEVEATFFVVGDWTKKYPDAVKALHEAGMEIGNHSYDHKHVNKLSYGENLEDMTKCNELIEDITGEKIRFYRGPYGEYNNTVIQVAEELNMRVIQWNIDSLDYKGLTGAEMCMRIKKNLREGSIILMHNDTKYTASSLQQIINTIRSEGYDIVPLDELIYFDNYEINHEGRQIKRN